MLGKRYCYPTQVPPKNLDLLLNASPQPQHQFFQSCVGPTFEVSLISTPLTPSPSPPQVKSGPPHLDCCHFLPDGRLAFTAAPSQTSLQSDRPKAQIWLRQSHSKGFHRPHGERQAPHPECQASEGLAGPCRCLSAPVLHANAADSFQCIGQAVFSALWDLNTRIPRHKHFSLLSKGLA